MEFKKIVELLNLGRDNLIPRNIPYETVRKAYNESVRNSYAFTHPIEKADNEKYGYLGVLRLRDINYTHEYVTECRKKIVEIAKSKPTKIEQVATIYGFLVNNFTINLEYDKGFNVYYKSFRNIYEKSDKEISDFFEGIKEYHHPFKEVEINGETYIASTRCDLYETKTSLEGIISEEFLLLCSKVNPSFSVDQTFCRLKGDTKTYGLFSVNISDDENKKVYTLMSPTLDILNKQLTGEVEYKNFGLSNKDATSKFEFINKLNYENVGILPETVDNAFNGNNSFELND